MVQAAEVCGSFQSIGLDAEPPTGYSHAWKINFKEGQSVDNVVLGIDLASLTTSITEVVSFGMAMASEALVNALTLGEEETTMMSVAQKFKVCFTPDGPAYKFSGASKG